MKLREGEDPRYDVCKFETPSGRILYYLGDSREHYFDDADCTKAADMREYADRNDVTFNVLKDEEYELVPIDQFANSGRGDLDPKRLESVMDGMRKGSPLPPIQASLIPHGRQKIWAIDQGNHRLEAARLLGYKHIPVQITKK